MTPRRRPTSKVKKRSRKTASRKSRTARPGLKPSPTEPICTALLLAVGRSIQNDKEALELARRVVERELSGSWTVTSLGKGARDYRAKLASGKKLPVGKAWE